MASYTVTSDRLLGHVRGSVVTDDDADGLNIAVLVEGGHLTPAENGVAGSAPTKSTTKAAPAASTKEK